MFTAAQLKVHDVFKEQRYAVPYYQRPYSWGTENAETLWDDLFEAFEEGGSEENSYFLGSVVLVKKGSNYRVDIVDGQQRFITIQLLIRALAECVVDPEDRANLLIYVISKENRITGHKAEVVVRPGDRVIDAYRQIIEPGQTGLHKGRKDNNFAPNFSVFLEKAQGLAQATLLRFSAFVAQQTYLAVLTANSEGQALRIFSVLNDRGIDLHPVDILKARLLEKTTLSDDERQRLATRWEEYEDLFDRQGFQDLVGHIRMINVKRRTQNQLHDDILKSLKTEREVETFLKTELPAYVEAYSELRNSKDADLQNLVAIGDGSKFKDWEPVALYVLKNASLFPKPNEIFKRLASIVAFMSATRSTDGRRAGVFGGMLRELDRLGQKQIKIDDCQSFKITRDEFQAFEAQIATSTYTMRGKMAVMLWFESIVGDEGRSIVASGINVEHVLPRKPGNEKEWSKAFTVEEWEKNSDRLGNLTLLSGRLNRSVGRKPFAEKKAKMEEKGGTSWIWTQDVLKRTQWTLATIEAREKKMMKAARGAFRFRK